MRQTKKKFHVFSDLMEILKNIVYDNNQNIYKWISFLH